MRKYLLIAVLALAFLGVAFAAQFTPSSVTSAEIDGGHHNKLFNITITNDNTSANITQVNITLPGGFSFISASNGSNISQTSTNFTAFGTTLSWYNTSIRTAVVPAGGQATFWFNASYTGVNTNQSVGFNVTILTNYSASNTSNVTINITQVTWSVQPGQFYVKPHSIRINWTNGFKWNFTVTSNSSNSGNIKVAVRNVTGTTISANYSQSASTECSPMRLNVIDSAGAYTVNSTALAPGASDNMTLEMFSSCAPGRYFGKLNVTNATDTSIYAELNVTVDVPISTSNTINVSSGVGTFKGTLPAGPVVHQSFYFNTSNITNATGLRINFNWSNVLHDADIFLVNSTGHLISKSINNGSFEEIIVSNITQNDIWEIRITSNSSTAIDYSSTGFGLIALSAINITNQTDSQPFLDFGIRNYSQNASWVVRIKDMSSNINYTSLAESKELYLLNEFPAKNSNYTLYVANSTVFSKIRVAVNWTGGGSNYSIHLYNPSGVVKGSARHKANASNLTGLESEEFVETTDVSSGVWTVEVRNTTARFNVTAKLYVANTANWIQTNYSTTSLTQLGSDNDTKPVLVNLTVPINSQDGQYRGSITYKSSEGAANQIPIRFNLTSGFFVINNSIGSGELLVEDNIGYERVYPGKTVNLPIFNNGSLPLVIINNVSTSRLNLTSDGTKYIDFNFTYPSSIAAGAMSHLSVNFTINSSNTGNTSGLYKGWIFLNTTNSTPFGGFNLSITVNLTAHLDVTVREMGRAPMANADCTSAADTINNASATNNVTICSQIYWQNDSASVITELVNISNFSVTFAHANVSTESFSASAMYNASSSLYDAGVSRYKVNATLPASKPGGPYYVVLATTFTKNGITYSGSGNNSSAILYLNNTGIKLNLTSSSNTTSVSVNEKSWKLVNVTATNYGLPEARGTLLASSSNTEYANVDESARFDTDCGSLLGGDGRGFDVLITGNGTEMCHYQFNISSVGINVTGDKSLTVTATASNANFGNAVFTVTVVDTDSSSSSTTTTNQNSGSSNASTTVRNLTLNITPSIINITQGGTGSTTVSVTNNGNQSETNLKLNITGVSSSWVAVTPSVHANLLKGTTKDFSVTFSIPDDFSFVGEHIVTAEAKTDSASNKSTFKLRVLPTESGKTQINNSYQNLSSLISDLEEEIKDLKADGYNTTTLEADLAVLKSKMGTAGTNLNGGDYVSANQLLTEASSLISKINDGIKNAAKAESSSGSALVYAAILVVALVVVGAVGYMLLPPSQKPFGNKPVWAAQPVEQKYTYKPPKKSLSEIIKEFFSKK